MMHETWPRDSAYNAEADRERLASQTMRLRDFDRSVIDTLMASMPRSKESRSIRILDAGCADGRMVIENFSHHDLVRVEGLDKNAGSVARASALTARDERFTFTCFDLNDVVLKDEAYDIIICSYVLPHVARPQCLVSKLWRALAPGGAMLLRAGDDGWKVVQPTPPGWGVMLALSAEYLPMSDRQSGRKIPGYLKALAPQPQRVRPYFRNESTSGLSAEECRDFFRTYYGFRRNYLCPGTTKAPATALQHIARLLDESELFFLTRRPFASVTHGIFVAFKP